MKSIENLIASPRLFLLADSVYSNLHLISFSHWIWALCFSLPWILITRSCLECSHYLSMNYWKERLPMTMTFTDPLAVLLSVIFFPPKIKTSITFKGKFHLTRKVLYEPCDEVLSNGLRRLVVTTITWVMNKNQKQKEGWIWMIFKEINRKHFMPLQN